MNCSSALRNTMANIALDAFPFATGAWTDGDRVVVYVSDDHDLTDQRSGDATFRFPEFDGESVREISRPVTIEFVRHSFA